MVFAMNHLMTLLLVLLFCGNPARMLQDRQQQATIETLTDIGEGDIFTMDYKADYKLQEFIDADLISQAAVKSRAAGILLAAPQAPVKAEPVNPACSAFQAVTPEGDVIYGRNFDYRFKDGASILMRTRPRDGYQSLSMVSMNFVGYDGAMLCDGKTDLSMLVAAPLMQMDGMNEKGFAISVLVVVADECAQQYADGKHSIMTSVMMRMLLDRAADVDEALSMLENYNFFCDGLQTDRKPGNKSNYHFLLSDASGKTVVLEYVKKDGPGTDSEWVMNAVDEKIATNHFRSEGWRHLGRQDERWSRMQRTLEEKNGVLTVTEGMALLNSVHQTPHDNHEGKTQWSVIYNLTKKCATVCVNGDYSRAYTVSLKRFKRN